MTTFLEVFGARHDLLKERDRARQELGYDDLATEAMAVEERKFLRDLLRAYTDERRAEWRLPRDEIRSALYRCFSAVEEDDITALAAGLGDVCDLITGKQP